MRILKLVLSACLLVAFTPGCSSISVKMPANRFDSPEVRGQGLKAHVEGTVQGGNQASIVKDYTVVPPKTDTPAVTRSDFDFMVSGGVGVHERIDIDLKAPLHGPLMLQGKFQILGDPELEAKKDNYSLAVTGAVGYESQSDSGTQFLGTVRSDYTLRVFSYDFGLIGGYRFSDVVLVYTGPFFTQDSMSGEITQPSGTSGKYHIGGISTQYGWNVGLQLETGSFFFRLSEAWANGKYAGTSNDDFYTGAQIGARF